MPFAMRLGEQSDSVKNLQEYLAKYGYLDKSNITGYYGEVTKNAVASFQKVNGLGQDGAAGAQTMNMFYSGKARRTVRAAQARTGTTAARLAIRATAVRITAVQ